MEYCKRLLSDEFVALHGVHWRRGAVELVHVQPVLEGVLRALEDEKGWEGGNVVDRVGEPVDPEKADQDVVQWEVVARKGGKEVSLVLVKDLPTARSCSMRYTVARPLLQG